MEFFRTEKMYYNSPYFFAAARRSASVLGYGPGLKSRAKPAKAGLVVDIPRLRINLLKAFELFNKARFMSSSLSSYNQKVKI
jgi:hypothetical protein